MHAYQVKKGKIYTPIEEGSTIFLPDILGGLLIEFFPIQEPLRPPLLNKMGSSIRIFSGGLVLEGGPSIGVLTVYSVNFQYCAVLSLPFSRTNRGVGVKQCGNVSDKYISKSWLA